MRRRYVLAVPLALTPLGCFEDLGSADPPTACFDAGGCNGVAVYCRNQGVGGADESGGDGGSTQYNYWLVPGGQCGMPTCGGPIPDDEPGCCTVGCGACYVKVFSDVNTVHEYYPSLDRLCVGQDWPAAVDPLADWQSLGDGGGSGEVLPPGDYPDIESEIRTACSQRCSGKDNGSGSPAQCEDVNWSDVLTYYSWIPEQDFNCQVTMMLNSEDPLGVAIPWEDVGGPTYPMPLDCSLTDDCADWFYPSVAQFTSQWSSTGVITPETRNAAYLAVEDGPTSRVDLDLDMPGSAAGIDDGAPLFGLAEYSPLACGDDVCPFYLANLSAYNTTDAWDIQIMTDTGVKLKKRITNVQIDMIQSTLGVQHMALHKVAFAPGSIRLAVEITVANQPGQTNSYGNGTHSAIVENVEYVFANYFNNAFSLTHAFPLQAGEGTLTLQVAASERPPVASHDLHGTEACDDPSGLELDAHVTSTDPDADIVWDIWWIDGVACWNDCVLPFGSHQVAVEARDARDAVSKSATQWVYVATGC